jgi:hypothetical protein
MGKPRSAGSDTVILLKVVYLPAITLFIAGKFILNTKELFLLQFSVPTTGINDKSVL